MFSKISVYYIVKWRVKGKNNFLKEITYMTRNVILFTQCKIFWISNDILQPLVSSQVFIISAQLPHMPHPCQCSDSPPPSTRSPCCHKPPPGWDSRCHHSRPQQTVSVQGRRHRWRLGPRRGWPPGSRCRCRGHTNNNITPLAAARNYS